MDYLGTLLRRNGEFAGLGFNPNLRMMPSSKTLIIGCVDPRVDPMNIFELEPGEAAIFRNIGGRVNPALPGNWAAGAQSGNRLHIRMG